MALLTTLLFLALVLLCKGYLFFIYATFLNQSCVGDKGDINDPAQSCDDILQVHPFDLFVYAITWSEIKGIKELE